MADVVIGFAGGDLTVSKGLGGFPVELEARDGTSVPDTVVRMTFTRRDAHRLMDALEDVLGG